jgi:hypothetical protein
MEPSLCQVWVDEHMLLLRVMFFVQMLVIEGLPLSIGHAWQRTVSA